jgi:hypothetical protein
MFRVSIVSANILVPPLDLILKVTSVYRFFFFAHGLGKYNSVHFQINPEDGNCDVYRNIGRPV